MLPSHAPVTSPPGSASNPAALGLASHLLAGVLPFLSSGAIARMGLVPGVAALYLAGSVVLVLSLARRRVRVQLRAESAILMAPASRWMFIAGLAGFLVAGVAYYVGLANTPRVAEYIFLTRLDWIAQAAFAVVWLREPWTPRGLAGAAIALAGGLLLAWTGAFGASGLAAAALYVCASLAGYSCFKPLSAARGTRGATVLTMWRHWVNTAGFVGLAVARPGSALAHDITGLILALVAGIVIVVLFLLRFSALTGIPLWVLAAQAPIQALVAIVVTVATTGSLPATTALAAIGLIVVGEVLVMGARGRP
jgi:drug/metabolite transporter (DMT)-like permease